MTKANSSETSRKSRKNQEPGPDNFLDQLFVWLDASLVRQSAGELARECQAAVWGHTCEKVRELTLAEAKEYIRAAAPEFLLREVDLVLQRRRVGESLRQRILAEATEQLATLVVKNLARSKGRPPLTRVA